MLAATAGLQTATGRWGTAAGRWGGFLAAAVPTPQRTNFIRAVRGSRLPSAAQPHVRRPTGNVIVVVVVELVLRVAFVAMDCRLHRIFAGGGAGGGPHPDSSLVDFSEQVNISSLFCFKCLNMVRSIAYVMSQSTCSFLCTIYLFVSDCPVREELGFCLFVGDWKLGFGYVSATRLFCFNNSTISSWFQICIFVQAELEFPWR